MPNIYSIPSDVVMTYILPYVVEHIDLDKKMGPKSILGSDIMFLFYITDKDCYSAMRKQIYDLIIGYYDRDFERHNLKKEFELVLDYSLFMEMTDVINKFIFPNNDLEYNFISELSKIWKHIINRAIDTRKYLLLDKILDSKSIYIVTDHFHNVVNKKDENLFRIFSKYYYYGCDELNYIGEKADVKMIACLTNEVSLEIICDSALKNGNIDVTDHLVKKYEFNLNKYNFRDGLFKCLREGEIKKLDFFLQYKEDFIDDDRICGYIVAYSMLNDNMKLFKEYSCDILDTDFIIYALVSFIGKKRYSEIINVILDLCKKFHLGLQKDEILDLIVGKIVSNAIDDID